MDRRHMRSRAMKRACATARSNFECRARRRRLPSAALPQSRAGRPRHRVTTMARVAINGLGRIGRATLKIVMDTPGLHLVAANELASPEDVAYLLKYDSVYGRYDKPVTAENGTLVVA